MSRMPSDLVLVALIVAVAPTITAVTGFVMVLRRLTSYKHEINHRMDELLESTRAEGHAEGVDDERNR